MSGLEGLAALGLACSIFQTISFGRETLALVKDVYRNGTIDQSLVDKSTAIQEVASDIIAVKIPPSLSKHLDEEITFLKGHNAKGSLRATVKTAVKTNWRKRRLEKMEKDLADSEQVMQSALLAWIFKSTNATNEDIDSLGANMRHFVLKYKEGCKQASELVSSEALQVRETIVRESGKTEMAIREHVTQTSAKFEQSFKDHLTQTDREKLREKLLNSLKYPGMNERANQVEDPHGRTFHWLFKDQDNLSPKDDETGRPEEVWSSFTDWLQSDLSIYWIMGKPGSGKSTLSKFILSEPRTRTLLEQWRRDVLIASHYFWRPGTIMQRNVKGMLCSIAYQLVFAIPKALEYALVDVDKLATKDAYTDWAVPDLKRFCLGLIRHLGRPLCLLVDGLDECGPEDDHQDLLDVLESFKLQDVKIIASSRNEPVFESRFRHQPQLRVQDLTLRDLHAYATAKLHDEIQKDRSFASDLATKAEGVFLWLVLVVQSLNRGFSNGDSVTDLRKRMETSPKRLNDLYKDMWARLNDDMDIYRKDAALYFRIYIATHDRRLVCTRDGFSIMEMMLASSKVRHDEFAENSIVSKSQLMGQCERFRKNVEVRCAGLLNAPREDLTHSEVAPEGLGNTERALLFFAHKDREFLIIHRSAHDFLMDTIDGQNILLYEGTPAEDLDLCVLGAGLRTAEIVHSILHGPSRRLVHFNIYDLTKLAECRDSAVEALFSRCFELNSSSGLLLVHPYPKEMLPTRIAGFFGVASEFPNLDRYCINMIEKRLFGRVVRLWLLNNGLEANQVVTKAARQANTVLEMMRPQTRILEQLSRF
ncbi:hypothetical protein DHEL01_v201571 [Diaporthe helianthi]|uniref:Nephrocystin 3-like N-terminal domain-containing protein n=1 Tax=Diaporthe helianthi TaxID=158607 RepID=A0A2P5IC06_DIAHE|nr:hypothetical protein DHEL01_v201571 [Diaporthe helianthi]